MAKTPLATVVTTVQPKYHLSSVGYFGEASLLADNAPVTSATRRLIERRPKEISNGLIAVSDSHLIVCVDQIASLQVKTAKMFRVSSATNA